MTTGHPTHPSAAGAGLDDTLIVAAQRRYDSAPLGRRDGGDRPGTAVTGGQEALAVSLRNQAIDRLEELNRNHARLAFEATGAPICPHAVAFLYMDTVQVPSRTPGKTVPWRKVVAAVRVVEATADVREVKTLLFRLSRLARQRYVPTPGGFNPAVHMADYRDKSTGQAEYIGIAVSTLDTLSTRWERAFADAHDTDDLGGRAFILLADHTAILVDRPAPRRGRRELDVHSTGDLRYPDALQNRRWTAHHDVSKMTVDQEVWELMHELHRMVYQQNPRPTL